MGAADQRRLLGRDIRRPAMGYPGPGPDVSADDIFHDVEKEYLYNHPDSWRVERVHGHRDRHPDFQWLGEKKVFQA